MTHSSWQSSAIIKVGPGRPCPAGIERNDRGRFPYQDAAITALDAWFTSDRAAAVLCLPTGAGKTRTSVDFLLKSAVRHGACVLWLSHRTELIDQAIATLASRAHTATHDVRIGRFAGDRKARADEKVHVLVASIPTLVRKDNLARAWARQGGFRLVVVDECHHAASRTWTHVIDDLMVQSVPPKLLGLSATPTRRSERERTKFWHRFDRVEYEARALDLIRDEYLARPELVPVRTNLEYRASAAEADYFEQFGELDPRLVKRIALDERRNELAAGTYLSDPSRWGKTLVFAARKEQAESLRMRLSAQGVRVDAVTGDHDAATRRSIIDRFRGGQSDVLINVQILTEGTDLPSVDTVFLARPTRSQVLFQQMVGRGMRGPKVGGSAHCRIVVLEDRIEGLLEAKLTHNYSWEAEQFQALGFTEPSSETVPVAAAPKPSTHDAVARAALIAELAERYREVLAAVGIAGHVQQARLLGWWEIGSITHRNQSPRRHVLPHFEGDLDLERGIAALQNAIRTRTAAPAPPPTRWVTAQLAYAFWYRAKTLADAPTYRALGEVADAPQEYLTLATEWLREPEFQAAHGTIVTKTSAHLGELAKRSSREAARTAVTRETADREIYEFQIPGPLVQAWTDAVPVLGERAVADHRRKFSNAVGKILDAQRVRALTKAVRERLRARRALDPDAQVREILEAWAPRDDRPEDE